MRKIGLLLLALIFTPVSHALDAKGTIDEIMICSTGSDGWIRTLQFKVDGKWFGTYADHHSGGYDNDITTSLVMMAYAQNSVVEVHFTNGWPALYKTCGINDGGGFYVKASDYIKLSRQP